MRHLNILKTLGLASVLILTSSAQAGKPDRDGHPGRGKGLESQHESQESDGRRKYRSHLSERERDELAELIIGKDVREYRSENSGRNHAKSLPPGLRLKLSRGGELPPGWQSKLQEGQAIDAETYRNAEHLSGEMLRRITGRDDAVELLRVGDRVLRVAQGSGTILDVIDLTDRAMRMIGQ